MATDIGTDMIDTADARTDGRRVEMAHEAHKSKVYQERIAEVHQEMEQLREGIHPDYLLGSTVLLNEKKERIRQAARCKEFMMANADAIFSMEEKLAKQEFDEARREVQGALRAKLESDLEMAEKEQKDVSPTGDGLTFREDSVTRAPRQGLRNKRPRGGELNLVVGKSRKVANIANIKPIAYHLSEYAVDQDLKNIKNIMKNNRSKAGRPVSVGVAPPEVLADMVEAEYINGLLVYDKKSYQVGDDILVESETAGRYAATITAVNAMDICVKRGQLNRAKLHYASLRRGHYKIRLTERVNWNKITRLVKPA